MMMQTFELNSQNFTELIRKKGKLIKVLFFYITAGATAAENGKLK